MKKTRIAILCVFSILAIALAGSAAAYDATYTHIDYSSTVAPTIDGQYTSADEWVASAAEAFGTHLWRNEWLYTTSVFENILVQASDATNDAGDTFTLCFDCNADGGTAPQTDDFKVVVTGHGATATVQYYQGTGTDWTPIATPASPQLAQTQTTLAILEMQVDKLSTDFAPSMYWAFMVSYNDANAGGTGVQSWPPAPASTDVPDGWGYIDYSNDPNPNPDAPEGIGFIAMAAASTIALIATTHVIRKRNKN